VSSGATVKLRLGTGWMSLNFETTSVLGVAKWVHSRPKKMPCRVRLFNPQPALPTLVCQSTFFLRKLNFIMFRLRVPALYFFSIFRKSKHVLLFLMQNQI